MHAIQITRRAIPPSSATSLVSSLLHIFQDISNNYTDTSLKEVLE